MSLSDRQRQFIGYLLSLAEEGQEDRGALAELRSGLGKEPGAMAQVHRHVVPYLPQHTRDDRWHYVTATLFGAFPEHRPRVSLGKAFAPLRANSDSVEARFVALLNAHAEDLDDHLRHEVSLLRANQQAFDWFRLFDDLLHWDLPDRLVQLRWARDFYGVPAIESGSSDEGSANEPLAEEEGND